MTLDSQATHDTDATTVEPIAVKMVLSEHVADRLLDRLSTDDAFRALFDSNPRAALREVGHVTPEQFRDIKGADPVLCLYSRKTPLASKEAIREACGALKARLTTEMFTFAVTGF